DGDAQEAELDLDLDLSSQSEDEETPPIPTQTDLKPVPSDESTDDPSEDNNIMEDLSILLQAPNDPTSLRGTTSFTM
ncbi:hypothetical protein RRG08_054053, partial [Elysia crispata]